VEAVTRGSKLENMKVRDRKVTKFECEVQRVGGGPGHLVRDWVGFPREGGQEGGRKI